MRLIDPTIACVSFWGFRSEEDDVRIIKLNIYIKQFLIMIFAIIYLPRVSARRMLRLLLESTGKCLTHPSKPCLNG